MRSFPSGRHQTDELAAAAEKRADHQRDSGDEGKQKPKHCQLPGQVSSHSTLLVLGEDKSLEREEGGGGESFWTEKSLFKNIKEFLVLS